MSFPEEIRDNMRGAHFSAEAISSLARKIASLESARNVMRYFTVEYFHVFWQGWHHAYFGAFPTH